MKQFNLNVLYALVLCVLIGYFEPANAQNGSDAAALMYNSAVNNPFFPNPLTGGSVISVISADQPVNGFLVSSTDGSQWPLQIIATNQPLVSTVENNAQFEPIIDSINTADSLASTVENNAQFEPVADTSTTDSLAGTVENNAQFEPIVPLSTTTMALPDGMSDGVYVFYVVGQSGAVYTSKISLTLGKGK